MNEFDVDDDLGRLIRDANPSPVQQGERPSPQAIAVRDRIIAGEFEPRVTPALRETPPRRWWPAIATPLAAAAAVLMIVVLTLGAPIAGTPTAVALTPPPLRFVDDGRDLAEVVHDARLASLREDGAVEAVRGATTTGWYFHVDDAGSAEETAVISPEVSVLEWAEDQSGAMNVYAGEPYWADLSDVPLPPNLPAPGTRLWGMQYEPGGAQLPDTGAPEATKESILALLSAHGLTDPTDGYAVFDAIERVQQVWTLPDEHHVLLLDVVRNARDITVLGVADDRAGRPVAALSVDMPGGKSELHLFVSQDTGRIVGTEVYMTADSGPFPKGAIISYSMWDLPVDPPA
jgi:hypothetical protein